MAIILITGGARSGKSTRAEARVHAFPGKPVYIATAEALDAEMRERIARHRARRGSDWLERETPLELVAALLDDRRRRRTLVDCLTLWLSNLMHAERDWEKEASARRGARAAKKPGRAGHQRGRTRHRARQRAGAPIPRRRRDHEPDDRAGRRRSGVRRRGFADAGEVAMSEDAETLKDLIADLRIGISLCTRLPVGPSAPVGDGEVARASWTFPIAGLLVGLAGALAYWVAIRLNVAPHPAAALALAATMALTGAMHEDGLADSFDGLGGKTREQKLEIMRDSRIGTFGACALVVTLLLRWSTLADIAEPRYVAIALISAHAAARAGMPAFMHLVPLARQDGLSSDAGRRRDNASPLRLIWHLLPAVRLRRQGRDDIAAVARGRRHHRSRGSPLRQIGGQTGDVLGAFEQVGEAIVLLVAASLF